MVQPAGGSRWVLEAAMQGELPSYSSSIFPSRLPFPPQPPPPPPPSPFPAPFVFPRRLPLSLSLFLILSLPLLSAVSLELLFSF